MKHQDGTIERKLAAMLMLTMIVAISIVLFFTRGFAVFEYEMSVSQRYRDERYQETGVDSTPWPAAQYRRLYPFSWVLLPVAVGWALWILRRRKCNALAVTLYMGVLANVTLSWLLLTLMVLYLMNQSFHGWTD